MKPADPNRPNRPNRPPPRTTRSRSVVPRAEREPSVPGSSDDTRRPSVNPTNRRVSRPQLPPDLQELEDRHSTLPPFEAPGDGDASPPLSPKRSIAQSRAFGIARAVAGVALVIGVSAGVAWAARRYVMTTPRFAVSDISVSGGARRTSDDIAAEAGISRGANVFTVDLDQARAKLLADPWISEATLARRLPGTILIQVVERDAGAIVALGDSYLSTRDGDIFKRLEPGDPSDLPIITGLTEASVTDDREGVARSIRRALDLASDYEHGPLATRAPLQEIHYGEAGAITLIVGKSAVSLALGEPPFRRKLEQASKVLGELDRRGAKADAIMLDNDARPERVVVRIK